MENINVCIICEEGDGETPLKSLTTKGIAGINQASKERNSNVVATLTSVVYELCRKRFTDKKEILACKRKLNEELNSQSKRKSQRFLSPPADATRKLRCFFCNNFIEENSSSSNVLTDQFVETISQICSKRNDEWAYNVNGKIHYFSSDLHAADCAYHQVCSINFRTGKRIPTKYRTEKNNDPVGRPENLVQKEAFLETCEYLENDDEEQLTIADLVDKMGEILHESDENPYSRRYMKTKLLNYYGSEIMIAKQQGKSDIVTLRPTANKIIRDFMDKPKNVDIELQKIQLIETAVNLLRSEVKLHLDSKTDYFPLASELSIENSLPYLPPLIQLFCSKLFTGKNTQIKAAAIGQSIVQAIRPRTIMPPLQLGLSIQLHHHFRSKYLIETLNHLGFCSSYKEVLKFERNAAMVCKNNFNQATSSLSFMKFMADNVDHNVCTLNGENTFHGMGMIAALTNGFMNVTKVKREIISDKQILSLSSVKKIPYKEYSIAKYLFKPLPKFCFEEVLNADILWNISSRFKQHTPIWSGYMHMIHNKHHESRQKDNIKFLPIIDLNPSEMTCILSTLNFLKELASQHDFPPVVTFDQPLYWKSFKILLTNQYSWLKDIVLMLGTFHTVMNLLGCVGYLMSKSGLSDLLELIYGSNAVIHMLSGKAYSRAIRGHLLVDQALTSVLFDHLSEEVLENNLEKLYTDFFEKRISFESIETNEQLATVKSNLSELKLKLAEKSRTAKLCINYQRVISVIKKLIYADRTGNWLLHLNALAGSLPVFAAAGHGNYAKSAYIYLQSMLNLKESHSTVYNHFKEGGFVTRRSDGCWNGLANDLVFEQMLMRSLKTTGGLTRGTRFGDVQRSVWLLANPICSEYSVAMEELTGILYSSSEQHKTATNSRVIRDNDDFQKLRNRIIEISPFSDDQSLRNIANGVLAESIANVDNFYLIGEDIVEKMENEDVFSYIFKRSYQVKTLAAVATSSKNQISVDPSLLFQRLLVVSKSTPLEINNVMKHELCSYPPSIFESTTLLRKANKPQLLDEITKIALKNESLNSASQEQVTDVQFILDGGSLLHRVKWKKNATYLEIIEGYSDFVTKHYKNAVIIFDGYSNNPSTKDGTHDRRGSQSASVQINFTKDMICYVSKADFLSNPMNKQKLIKLIGEKLTTVNCVVSYSEEDADLDILKTAVNFSLTKDTVVSGKIQIY